MKQLSAFVFLALFAWNSLGFYVYSCIEKRLHEKKMEKALMLSAPDECFTAMSFTKEEFDRLEWIEDYEISINGNHFDVARRKTENGKIVLLVIADHDEDALVRKLEKQLNVEHGDKHPAGKSKPVAKTTLCMGEERVQIQSPPVIILPEKSHAGYADRLSDLTLPVPFPPPRTV